MAVAARLSILVAFFAVKCFVDAAPERAYHLRGDPLDITRLRRNAEEAGTQEIYSRELVCRVDMIGLRGEYTYHARPEEAQTVCATYLLGEPNDLVEIEFTEFNIECNEENQIQFFDGWTMGVGSFPSTEDHPLPMAERVVDVCSQRRRVFRSHQNAAMITFKLGSPTASFTIAFRPIHNPEPCNVIAPEASGTHTLRNFGHERNCSFSIIYPVTINILEMAVGGQVNGDARLRCHLGLDFVELLEGNSLETTNMRMEEGLCGNVGNMVRQTSEEETRNINNRILSTGPRCQSGSISVPLMCQNSVVRLVSSSHYENEVSLQFNRLNIDKSECSETV